MIIDGYSCVASIEAGNMESADVDFGVSWTLGCFCRPSRMAARLFSFCL